MNMTYIIIAVAVLVVLYVIGVYNKLVKLSARGQEAWHDIEVQLKRRYDLIPNLVETVKGYATHEQDTLQKVIEARNAAMAQPANASTSGATEGALAGALKSVFALSEAYPDLKANQGFINLQNELSDTENKIQAARRFYNTNVRDLSIAIDAFPSNIVAKMGSFQKMAYFELPEGDAANNPVAVKF